MEKSTDMLKKELSQNGITEILQSNDFPEYVLSTEIENIMCAKHLSPKDVWRRAGWIDGNYLKKMLNGSRTNISSQKLIQLAFGLRLTPDEVERLFKKLGMVLYAKNPTNLVILKCLQDELTIEATAEKIAELTSRGLLPNNDDFDLLK